MLKLGPKHSKQITLTYKFYYIQLHSVFHQ